MSLQVVVSLTWYEDIAVSIFYALYMNVISAWYRVVLKMRFGDTEHHEMYRYAYIANTYIGSPRF